MRQTEQGAITQKYCRKFRRMTSSDLARKIVADNPDLFSCVEAARSRVRDYRGTNGEQNRSTRSDVDCFVDGMALGPMRGQHKPKILIFDIETTPNLAYVWRTYKENVAPGQMVEHSHVLCYAAKWLGEKEVLFDSMQGDKDDKRVCKSLWKLFDQADVVVAHNGNAFDVLCMNARWVFHGFPPPSAYKQVDTLRLAKQMFRFQINKLDYIARYLGIGRKVEHEGFDLWLKCMRDDKQGWKKMQEYNIQDVLLLEEVYLKLRAWDRKHPIVSLMYDDDERRCPVCGSMHIKSLTKSSYTAASEYKTFRCENCGKVMRSRKPEKRKSFSHA